MIKKPQENILNSLKSNEIIRISKTKLKLLFDTISRPDLFVFINCLQDIQIEISESNEELKDKAITDKLFYRCCGYLYYKGTKFSVTPASKSCKNNSAVYQLCMGRLVQKWMSLVEEEYLYLSFKEDYAVYDEMNILNKTDFVKRFFICNEDFKKFKHTGIQIQIS